MGRSTYSHEKLELKKRPWTREEDQKLLAYIEEHGYGRWRSLPAKAGLQRCGKSCRLRWKNYLRPGIKRGKFSLQEEKTIIHLHALLGNRWSAIATHLPKRTDNEIKNYWNTHLKKRLTKMGIDPVTHKPQSFSDGQSKDAANLSHMTQWESARLEAEARLVRQSNLQLRHNATIPPPVSLAAPPVPPPMPQCLDVLKVWKGTTNSTLFNSAIGSLESPTSTLILSMDLCSNPITEFINGNTSVTNMISIQESGACGVGTPNNFLDQVMENSMLLHDENNVAGSVHDLLPISDGYNMTSTYGDFEENKNYWNDILNLVTSST